jgi:hypothetical protein
VFNGNEIGRETGYCHLVFVASDKTDGEILDSDAWAHNEFQYSSKKDYENGGRQNPSEYLNENFNCGGGAEALMESILEEIEFKEGDGDRLFEVTADYTFITTRNYWGEYDGEDEVDNVKWQEISKEEWEIINGNIGEAKC